MLQPCVLNTFPHTACAGYKLAEGDGCWLAAAGNVVHLMQTPQAIHPSLQLSLILFFLSNRDIEEKIPFLISGDLLWFSSPLWQLAEVKHAQEAGGIGPWQGKSRASHNNIPWQHQAPAILTHCPPSVHGKTTFLSLGLKSIMGKKFPAP